MAGIKPTITINELQKIDIRVGRILLVEDVAGSDKLVKLQVDFGDFHRQILVGLNEPKGDRGQAGTFCSEPCPKNHGGRAF